MDTLKAIFHYLANLEWTERRQPTCRFCDESNFKSIVYQDDDLIAVDNHRSAGEAHWLILPRHSHARHIRDIEALTEADLPLLLAMDAAKKELLQKHFPEAKRSEIHSGYHRGRRHLIGGIILPDIVSVHHLHLHIIVRPRPFIKFFKYPFWLRFMWMSDTTLVRKLRGRRTPRMNL